MNTLDNLLLIIFVAVLLFYCYKKKRLPFLKPRKTGNETETMETTGNTPTNSNIIPMPVSMGAFPQMYPYGIPTGTPIHTAYCKIIGVDNTVIDNDADLEHIINTELSKLTATGFTIQNVNAFVFNTADGTDTMRISFCITYGK